MSIRRMISARRPETAKRALPHSLKIGQIVNLLAIGKVIRDLIVGSEEDVDYKA